MPRDYAGLAPLLIPRPIHDEVAYQNTVEIAEVFAGFETAMNPDQTDYFDLLCNLIADYEAVEEPNLTPLEILRHALNEHRMNASDLARVLEVHRTLGPKNSQWRTCDYRRTRTKAWSAFRLACGRIRLNIMPVLMPRDLCLMGCDYFWRDVGGEAP